MTIGFHPTGSTPLPDSLLAEIVLAKIVDRTPRELVALGYGKLTVDDIARLAFRCRHRVVIRDAE
jgi:hypothetical protein